MTFKIETKLDTWHINCKWKKKSESFSNKKNFSEKKNLKTIFQFFFFFSKKNWKIKKKLKN